MGVKAGRNGKWPGLQVGSGRRGWEVSLDQMQMALNRQIVCVCVCVRVSSEHGWEDEGSVL